ncbi:hypothetical protein, partial [Aliivibrio sp. S10_S31]|uniref:hypothetical protein n=1 Tax=Aliivibrio sp. S10_S31 TaxID=2720224 RepID=UPI001EED3770
EPDEMKTKRQQRRNSRLLSRNYESRDPIDEPCKKFRTQYAQRLHNTFITMPNNLNFTALITKPKANPERRV